MLHGSYHLIWSYDCTTKVRIARGLVLISLGDRCHYIRAAGWVVRRLSAVVRSFIMLRLLSPTTIPWLKWLLWGSDRCCVKGSLLEINNRVVDHPPILHTKVRSHTEMVDLDLYWVYKGWSHNGGPGLCYKNWIRWLRNSGQLECLTLLPA